MQRQVLFWRLIHKPCPFVLLLRKFKTFFRCFFIRHIIVAFSFYLYIKCVFCGFLQVALKKIFRFKLIFWMENIEQIQRYFYLRAVLLEHTYTAEIQDSSLCTMRSLFAQFVNNALHILLFFTLSSIFREQRLEHSICSRRACYIHIQNTHRTIESHGNIDSVRCTNIFRQSHFVTHSTNN